MLTLASIHVNAPTLLRRETNLPANFGAPHKAAILAILLVSYVMIVLDTSIVLTGLPKIHQELGFTDTGLAWVQSAYTLTFGGLLLLAARRYLAESETTRGHFDVAGAASSTLGMTALVYGLIRSGGAGWGDALTQGALAAGVLLLAAFILIERRAAQAILPLRLFADTQRNAAYGARVLFMGGHDRLFLFHHAIPASGAK